MITTFSTDRLQISSLSHDDAEFFLELVNTPDWLTYIGDRNIRTKEDALAFINRTNGNEDAYIWSIREKDTKLPIGILTLIKRQELENPDFGFALLPSHYKKGYAFEAAQKFFQVFQNNNNLQEVFAITLEHNNPSIALLEKLGFTFKQTISLKAELLSLYVMQLNTND